MDTIFSEVKIRSEIGALVSNQFGFYAYCKNGQLTASFDKPTELEAITFEYQGGRVGKKVLATIKNSSGQNLQKNLEFNSESDGIVWEMETIEQTPLLFAIENKYLGKWLETTDTHQIGFTFPKSVGTSQIFGFLKQS